MKKAIERDNNLKNVLVFECELDESKKLKDISKFKGVSQYFSFEYSTDYSSIRIFRFYNIGTGLLAKLSSFFRISIEKLVKMAENTSLKIISEPSSSIFTLSIMERTNR